MSEENVQAPGWYTHPERPEEEWYWDGRVWTESRWASKPRHQKRASRDGAAFLRGKFRVTFDGHWQGDFDTLADAMEWAEEVSQTGRTVLVIERRTLSNRFRAAFPQERAREAEEDWKRTNHWARALQGHGWW